MFIVLFGNLSATPELESYTFKREHISIDVIYRYSDDVKKLYYRSLAENLNEYISDLKSQGKLNRGRIHFEIMTGVWMDESLGVQMYRYKSGYYCWLNGLIQSISQEYLTKIINYFTCDTWESFCYNDSLLTPKQALNIFNKRIHPIMPFKNFKDKKVLELNWVSVYFHHDSLICKGTRRNFGQIYYVLPFSKGQIDFIVCRGSFYVIEKGELINQIKASEVEITGGFHEKCWVEVFPQWINFKNRDRIFLSYSIKKNRFYKL